MVSGLISNDCELFGLLTEWLRYQNWTFFEKISIIKFEIWIIYTRGRLTIVDRGVRVLVSTDVSSCHRDYFVGVPSDGVGNGMCASTGSDADADPSDSNADADADCYSDANADTLANACRSDTDTFANADTYSDTDTYPNADTYPDADTFANADTYSDTDTFANSDTYRDCYTAAQRQ